MLPGGDIREHNVCFLSYAEDTQLYIIFTSAESNDAAAIDSTGNNLPGIKL